MRSWVFIALVACASASADSYSEREEVVAFAHEMATKHGFEAVELLTVLGKAQYQQSIIDAISRPAEKTLTWAEYRKIFLTSSRIQRGQEFARQHSDALVRAEAQFGVPAKVIVAVLGVETLYGKIKGGYRVLDALVTLGFDYPPRAAFFRRELGEFLLLAREEKLPLESLVGSYAGAMGYGQFIPSSYRAYAIDFSGDGVKDIWDNPTDAIGSIAAYLSKHGWRRGEQVTVNVSGEMAPDDVLLDVSLKPYTDVAQVRKSGVRLADSLASDAGVTLMHLRGGQGDEYWVGFHNFYVITRYNHSKLYAMAVFQLGEALAEGLSS